MLAFTLQAVSALSDVVSEAVELALICLNVKFLVYGVEYSLVLFVYLVLFLERNETYSVPFCSKGRYLLGLFCGRLVSVNGLKGFDDLALLLEILLLNSAL